MTSDVRINEELKYTEKYVIKRYYGVNGDKLDKFIKKIKKTSYWLPTNNCSSWASNVVESVTGEEFSPDSIIFGIETPAQLSKIIFEFEKKNPSSYKNPIDVN